MNSLAFTVPYCVSYFERGFSSKNSVWQCRVSPFSFPTSALGDAKLSAIINNLVV